MIFHQLYCRKCSLFFVMKTIKEPCPICGWTMLANYHKDNLFNKNLKGDRMKIYIAASHPNIEQAKLLAYKLDEAGFELVSIWHDVDKAPAYNSAPRAIRDMLGVERCDLFIEFIGDNASKGGRHCELGMALAWGKKIILVGSDDGCVFTHLPYLAQVNNVEELLKSLI